MFLDPVEYARATAQATERMKELKAQHATTIREAEIRGALWMQSAALFAVATARPANAAIAVLDAVRIVDAARKGASDG